MEILSLWLSTARPADSGREQVFWAHAGSSRGSGLAAGASLPR